MNRLTGITPHLEVKISTYRTKLNALINYLHGKYFKNENLPFSGNPQTVVSQQQTQNQTMNIAIFDVIEAIDRALYKDKNIAPEDKSFLEKLKERIKGVNTYSQLILTILSTAKDFGKNIEQIIKLFE